MVLSFLGTGPQRSRLEPMDTIFVKNVKEDGSAHQAGLRTGKCGCVSLFWLLQQCEGLAAVCPTLGTTDCPLVSVGNLRGI